MVKWAKENPVSNHCGGKWYTKGLRVGLEKGENNVKAKPEHAFMNQ